MKAPYGIELEAGQKWREVDPRFLRIVEVIGWDDPSQVVYLDTGARKTRAALKRFNGKRGGYEPHPLPFVRIPDFTK